MYILHFVISHQIIIWVLKWLAFCTVQDDQQIVPYTKNLKQYIDMSILHHRVYIYNFFT